MAFATVQTRRIEYQWFRPGRIEHPNSIVMLHEGLGSLSLWKKFPAQLAHATGRAVLAYSRHGYGSSSPLREKRQPRYMHDEALEALPALLKELKIENPVLFGHSDGASIAIIHAGARRWPVAALVLLAPHVFVEDVGVRSIEQVREAYLFGDLKNRLAKRHNDPDSAFWGWNDIWLDARFRDWNIEEYLPAIESPVLAVRGHDDEYGTMEQIHALVRAVERIEVKKLANCGHSPHRDQPEIVLAATAGFLEHCA
ncbi:MAG: alpha/beta hydrolase [Betaproteobacteria bacterium]|nr:alpha/beta hydrolase [Betaproteobacteria bacterium]